MEHSSPIECRKSMLASREPSPRSPSRAASTMNEVALIDIMIIPFASSYTELVIDIGEESYHGRHSSSFSMEHDCL